MAFVGYIQVYTGNGKGKTTAALGLALRAAGWGFCTYIAQFMKKGGYGELRSMKKIGCIEIEQFGLAGFHHDSRGIRPGEVAAAEKGLCRAKAAMQSGKYRIVILDEINTLLHFRILPVRRVLDLIDAKPADVELVLTGRYALASIMKRAHLVTEMREKRHYFNAGVQARKGIEH